MRNVLVACMLALSPAYLSANSNTEFSEVKHPVGELSYIISYPEPFDPEKEYPVLVYLHGAGERGDNLDVLLNNGIPRRIKNSAAGRFVVVAPQCPKHMYWPQMAMEFKQLLERLDAALSVDRSRVYLTGYSMGGYGTWYLSAFFPDVFAAIVPAAGGVRALDLEADRKAFDTLNSIPIWAFHGRQDTIVRISEQQRIVDYLQPSHPNLKFSIDEGGNHFIWDFVYADHDIYSWMLEQQKVSSE